MGKIEISGRTIGVSYPPYVIAEISANHNGRIETALQLIEEAKKAGADAVKLQTYTADTITLDCASEDFQIVDGPWRNRTLYELYQEAHTPWDWHRPLFDRARELDITIFSSPFDNSAVDFLENLNAPAYKIASFEAVDLPLIKYAASTGKPLIISTGMANAEEIQEAINAARDGGCKALAILHCVSGYPAPSDDYNLRTLSDMVERYGLVTGLSDHTLDNITAITSIALGATIIEKHFTMSRDGGGPDDIFSLEPEEMKRLCQAVQTAWSALGQINYGMKSSEMENSKFRRSLYFVSDLKKGEVITKNAIRSIRPGFGLHPKFIDMIVGKKAKENIEFGTAARWDLVE